ncbi:MAG: hypothetical protein K2J74_01555 [Muribaculaceae bacterium]|nr:hypothetical protein [Muribaculaceae bacterium]
MMRKIDKSVLVPLLLLVYLGVMVYLFGMRYYYAGDYAFFFGITGSTLLIIIALHFVMKRRERLRREREDDIVNSSKR